MKRSLWILAMLTIASSVVLAQSTGQSSTINEITKALQNIAKKNYSIENIIYDGMTYREVTKILGETFDVISDTNWVLATRELRYEYVSYHGNYVIFWSDEDYHGLRNPTVIGYARVGTKTVQHNVLQ